MFSLLPPPTILPSATSSRLQTFASCQAEVKTGGILLPDAHGGRGRGEMGLQRSSSSPVREKELGDREEVLGAAVALPPRGGGIPDGSGNLFPYLPVPAAGC